MVLESCYKVMIDRHLCDLSPTNFKEGHFSVCEDCSQSLTLKTELHIIF